MKLGWQYQPNAEMPGWVARVSHDRDGVLFVKTIEGVTEVQPGECIYRAKGGVRVQVLRAAA